jgi:hypothetical protein
MGGTHAIREQCKMAGASLSAVLRIHDILVWIRIQINLQVAYKKLIFYLKVFSAYYFLKVHLHHYSKIKSQKEVTKQRESRFFLLFLLDDRRIRIRIQGTPKHMDPTDLDPDADQDPQHCLPGVAGGEGGGCIDCTVVEVARCTR